jgi:hypothetical protein
MSKPTSVRINSADLAPARLRECVAWVESLGLIPADLGAIFAIVSGEEGWELHVTEHLRNAGGHKYIDQASQDIVSKPVVVQLGPDATWPDFETGRIL